MSSGGDDRRPIPAHRASNGIIAVRRREGLHALRDGKSTTDAAQGARRSLEHQHLPVRTGEGSTRKGSAIGELASRRYRTGSGCNGERAIAHALRSGFHVVLRIRDVHAEGVVAQVGIEVGLLKSRHHRAPLLAPACEGSVCRAVVDVTIDQHVVRSGVINVKGDGQRWQTCALDDGDAMGFDHPGDVRGQRTAGNRVSGGTQGHLARESARSGRRDVDAAAQVLAQHGFTANRAHEHAHGTIRRRLDFQRGSGGRLALGIRDGKAKCVRLVRSQSHGGRSGDEAGQGIHRQPCGKSGDCKRRGRFGLRGVHHDLVAHATVVRTAHDTVRHGDRRRSRDHRHIGVNNHLERGSHVSSGEVADTRVSAGIVDRSHLGLRNGECLGSPADIAGIIDRRLGAHCFGPRVAGDGTPEEGGQRSR